jgi:hypothetical protein
MNRTTLITLTTIGVAVLLGGAVIGQQRGNEPGMATQARVWIENRSPAEAIPVNVAETAAVRVVAPVTLEASTVVNTHAARQQWEYRTIAIAPPDDVAAALKTAGAEGWEAVGIVGATPNGAVLLKRPR